MTPAVPASGTPAASALDPQMAVPRRGFLRRLLRRPAAVVALGYLVGITLACVLAPVLAPYLPLEQNLRAVMAGPSMQHLLGTDDLGRDVLSRLLWGGRTSLLGVAEAVAVLAVIGTVLGLLAGYFSGWVDWLISRLVEIVLAIPSLIVILGVLAAFGQSMLAAMVTFGLLGGVGLVRIVRATTIAVRSELYVAAAQVSGVSELATLVRHILPRITGPIIVQISLFAGVALSVQSGLAFLSLGITPPEPSWGGMVGTAAQLVQQDAWMLVPSGGIIALTILAFGILGDTARDASVENWSVEQQSGRRRRRRRPAAVASVNQEAVSLETSTSSAGIVTTDLREGEPILAVRDLTIGFGTEQQHSTVVDGLNFDLYPGEIVGLVGESGSGKTVTALALLELLPANGRVLRGSACLNGTDIFRMTRQQLTKLRGHEIGLISQEPMSSLDPAFTVGSQLREVVRVQHKCGRREADERVLELLRTVRLPEPEKVAKKYLHELSGGMAQRVVIALALSSNPKVLIADEPTTALDVTVEADILELLRALQRSQNMTVVFVTHNLAVVADLCDRALVMKQGRIVEAAPTDRLFAAPQHDYTKSLLAATPSLIDLPGRLRPGAPVASAPRWSQRKQDGGDGGCHREPLNDTGGLDHPVSGTPRSGR